MQVTLINLSKFISSPKILKTNQMSISYVLSIHYNITQREILLKQPLDTWGSFQLLVSNVFMYYNKEFVYYVFEIVLLSPQQNEENGMPNAPLSNILKTCRYCCHLWPRQKTFQTHTYMYYANWLLIKVIKGISVFASIHNVYGKSNLKNRLKL
jgi:hypothetical protein